MKKNLFLTGPLGVGKTTLLRKVLGYEALSYAGGFVTERAEDEDGLLLGYDFFPALLRQISGYIPDGAFLICPDRQLCMIMSFSVKKR